MVKAKTTSNISRRQGFTLVELMIVITIIAILAGLLLPAINGARKQVRITGVKNEISQLDSAIAGFKTNHVIEPPSSIILFETGSDTSTGLSDWNITGTSSTVISGISAADTASSRATIQQMWPQFDFTKNRDLNNDGDGGTAHEYVILSPSECLAFFLGGMATAPSGSTTVFSTTGFSKDPTDPFARTSGVPREASLFEFQTARLSDINGNKFPEYLDNLPGQKMPYLYYSSYDGNGYNEASSYEFASGSSSVLATPYWQGADWSSARWKASSHQIISPGFDGSYGYGGPYLSAAGGFPAATGTPGTGAQPLPTATQRLPEADNITNFSTGTLQ